MAGVVRLRALMTVSLQGEVHEAGKPFADATQTITNGVSGQTTVATATTDHALTVDGVSTITALYLKSDQAISVKLGASGSNVAFALAAYCPLTLIGTSLSAVYLSNASGYTASIDYVVAG